jgi:cobalamin biosynthesis protein CbiG
MNILQAIQDIVKFTPKFHALNETGKIQITLAPDNKGGVTIRDQNHNIYFFEIIDQSVTEKTSDILGGDRRVVIALELKDHVQGE